MSNRYVWDYELENQSANERLAEVKKRVGSWKKGDHVKLTSQSGQWDENSIGEFVGIQKYGYVWRIRVKWYDDRQKKYFDSTHRQFSEVDPDHLQNETASERGRIKDWKVGEEFYFSITKCKVTDEMLNGCFVITEIDNEACEVHFKWKTEDSKTWIEYRNPVDTKCILHNISECDRASTV